MKKIQIFTVGGTLDKIYFDAKSTYQIGEPYIEEMLSELPLSFEYQVESLLKKDSLDMTEQDREVVLQAVKKSPHDKILITHGTDTMVATATHLSSVKDKTIVITGSLQPGIFKNTDAPFNIGVGLGALQTLAHGIYVAMNGRVFDYDKVVKDLEISRFVDSV